LSIIKCHRLTSGALPTSHRRCAIQSCSPRVGPQDGSIIWPVATSRLTYQESVSCRIYSNSRRKTWKGEHGQVQVFALQCLHPGQLIHADRSFSLFGSLSSLCINLASLHDFLFPLGVFFLGQPIPKPVGLEAPFLSSRAACRGEICVTMPRRGQFDYWKRLARQLR
jgi:hypothetical protein